MPLSPTPPTVNGASSFSVPESAPAKEEPREPVEDDETPNGDAFVGPEDLADGSARAHVDAAALQGDAAAAGSPPPTPEKDDGRRTPVLVSAAEGASEA